MVVQKGLHGDRPAPYHLFNVLVMAGAALLTQLGRLDPAGISSPPPPASSAAATTPAVESGETGDVRAGEAKAGDE